MSNEGLLSRWSRRKLQDPHQNELEDQQLQQQLEAPPGLDDEAAAVPVEQTPPPLTDADMPDIETLTEDSDFSGFMSPGVSDELRNLALRKLFRAPFFNERDGLDEYDDDYTSFEKLGDIVTCDMKHQMEMEARKKLEQAALLEEDEQEQLGEAEPAPHNEQESAADSERLEHITEDPLDNPIEIDERDELESA